MVARRQRIHFGRSLQQGGMVLHPRPELERSRKLTVESSIPYVPDRTRPERRHALGHGSRRGHLRDVLLRVPGKRRATQSTAIHAGRGPQGALQLLGHWRRGPPYLAIGWAEQSTPEFREVHFRRRFGQQGVTHQNP